MMAAVGAEKALVTYHYRSLVESVTGVQQPSLKLEFALSMKSPYLIQHRFAGILVCLLGIFVLIGWMSSSEVMVRVVPGSPAMTINTAVLFLLTGFCLITATLRGWIEQLFKLAAAVILLVPLAVIGQHLLGWDLGLDWGQIHSTISDGRKHPGRMAPITCVAFLLAGIVLFLSLARARKHQYRRISFTLSGMVCLTGILALLGYLLQLESMYRLAAHNRMSVLTGIGITVLGAGLWGLSANKALGLSDTPLGQAQRITRLSAALLAVFALTAGLTGFGVLRSGFEESSKNNLKNNARTNAFVISSELQRAALISRSVVNRTILKRHLAAAAAPEAGPDASSETSQDIARILLGSGFSGVRLFNPEQQLLASEGQLMGDSAPVVLKLESQPGLSLLWSNGYIMRSEQDVIQDGQRIGRVVTEYVLEDVTRFMVEAAHLGETHNVMLCGREGINVVCFPSRFHPEGMTFPMFKQGGNPAFSVSRALIGEWGAETTTDPRGEPVQAGFAPLPNYGLGLMVKRGVAELYAPLRDRLQILMAVLLVFVAIGTILLRKWVEPLVVQIALEQRRIKAILNNSNDAFIAIGADGRVSDWNLQAEETLGWSSEEAVGRDLAELVIPPAHRHAHNLGFQQFRETGTGPMINQRLEVTALHKDGHEIPVELSVASFHNGEAYGSSAFLRDLTYLKTAEAQAALRAKELEAAREALVQSQKLEAVGKLTGGVAHDFNNVLQVVRGSLQLLQLEAKGSAQIERRVATAMTAVDRGAKLSAQLLAFARKQPLQPKVMNLARLMLSLGEMLQRALGDAIEVQTDVEEDLWNTVADPNQLENVILNLAINARDAMNGEGRLTITVSNAVLDNEYVRSIPGLQAGEFVMLAITDTGPGMPEDVKERAFEPFFTTKPEGEGTGLGLSMAHGFVLQSEGHIRIFSEVGCGTTIKIYLRRSHEPEQPVTPPRPLAADGGSETILVVEDDPSVQATVVDTLAGLGYSVIKADNAEVALGIVEQNRDIDLLFTDVVMPGQLRSPELAEKAKQLIPGLKVLFTSGYTQDAIVHDGRLDPGLHLLSKPYDRDQLARKVRELLTGDETPVKNASRPDTPPTQSKTADAQTPLRIVFVEDNENFRQLVCEMLTLLGHEVEGFGDAESAIGRLQGAFDVLLTDVSLPGMSGLQLAAIAHGADPDTKIVLASGYGSDVANELDFEVKLLSKPFSMDELVRCLNS